jgi:hypothetical protein
MKILIPFSGGVNSTYAMWRWLTETDCEIVARYATEEFESDDTNDAAIEKLKKTVQFLRSKTRDFVFEEINWTTEYKEEWVPIREGFKSTYNIGAIVPRYEGFYQWIKETNVDGFSFGISLENSATDHGYLGTKKLHQRKIVEDTGVDIYLAGTKDLLSVPIGDDFDPDAIIKELSGRFEQYEFLPDELKVLSRKCHTSTCKKKQCRDCAYWRTYEKFVSEGKTGRDFDLYCAEKGSYGPWRHEADPETYIYRGGIHRSPIAVARGEPPILPYLDYY